MSECDHVFASGIHNGRFGNWCIDCNEPDDATRITVDELEQSQVDIAELVEALKGSLCRHCMDTGLVPIRDGENGQTTPCEWCRAKNALLAKHNGD